MNDTKPDQQPQQLPQEQPPDPEELRKRLLRADFEVGQNQHLRIPQGLPKK